MCVCVYREKKMSLHFLFDFMIMRWLAGWMGRDGIGGGVAGGATVVANTCVSCASFRRCEVPVCPAYKTPVRTANCTSCCSYQCCCCAYQRLAKWLVVLVPKPADLLFAPLHCIIPSSFINYLMGSGTKGMRN